jgi:hypothetical protein
MDERSGTIHLVESRDPGARSLVTTISRSEVEHALHADEGVDLVLDVERLAADGDGRENERIALAWTPEDLERLLAMSSADAITLTFDEEEVRRFLDDDVDAHGVRVKLAALTAVAGMAAVGAGTAGAMPAGLDGGGSAANPPAAAVAPASEISAGLGNQSAPAEATLAASDHGVLTSATEAGLGGTSAPAEASLASASEISSGLGDQSAPAEATLAASDHGVLNSTSEAGLGAQQPTSQPVSASPSDSTWSPSSAEIGAFAGVILAITAAGFAVRHQRHGGPPAPA